MTTANKATLLWVCCWSLLLAACQLQKPASQNTVAETEGQQLSEVPAVLEFEQSDLATADLGIDGLRGPAPAFSDPLNPTREELRRSAIYHNYRALVDVSAEGGFGRLYGPKPGDLPIPGKEFWTLGTLPGGTTHVMLLQVPETFAQTAHRPCLVAAPSSGSRGPFGAIGTTGDWALRNGCAIVYSDKGTGPWLANIGDGQAYEITGLRDAPDALEVVEPFSTRTWSDTDSLAYKHAFSGTNPEAEWGAATLASIRFALQQLKAFGVTGADLDIIAASISNGGAAVLAAAEMDDNALIDGVVASEPNVALKNQGSYQVQEGNRKFQIASRPAYEYGSLAALLEACATTSDSFSDSPFYAAQAPLMALLSGRCAGLAELGLVNGETVAEQTADAYAQLRAIGLHPDALAAQPANTLGNVWALIISAYANAYGRFSPDDRLCNVSFHAFGPLQQATEPDDAAIARLFATSAGLPPAEGIVPAVALTDGTRRPLILAPSTVTPGPAYGLDEMYCYRQLWRSAGEKGQRLRKGVGEILLSADLGALPAIILHGRSDALIWVNNSSRAYFSQNRKNHADDSRLSYIEVKNAQHFDVLLMQPAFAALFVPLHLYYEQALDHMLAFLREGAALPPSQVISTRPRGMNGATVPALQSGNVPAISADAAGNAIEWQGDVLRIPQ